MHKNGKSIAIFALEINEPQVNDFQRYLANGVNTNTFNSVASHTWWLLHVAHSPVALSSAGPRPHRHLSSDLRNSWYYTYHTYYSYYISGHVVWAQNQQEQKKAFSRNMFKFLVKGFCYRLMRYFLFYFTVYGQTFNDSFQGSIRFNIIQPLP